ncbi:MAG: ABC transporter ATP-binding protein [Limisphaerales bacterium]
MVEFNLKAWFKQIAEIFACAWRLRPHLRGGRYLVGAVIASSLCSAVLEGIGVGLLVPLLSLLLGGEGATPMRPIRWLQTWMPGHKPAFYVFLFSFLVLAAIGAKNLVLYSSQLLSAKLRRRISVNLRNSLFQRLHSADIHLFEQRTAGEIANVFFGETGRTLGAVDYLLLMGQRTSIALFYLIMLVAISWQLTLITILLAGVIGTTVAFVHRRLASSGYQISELNRKISSFIMESFAGIKVIRATNAQDHEIQRFRDLNEAQSAVEEKSVRANALLGPIAETVAVAGAMVIVGCAYYFFVRPGLMLSSYLLGFGFILLRLLPLVNQVYGLQGQLLYQAGGIKEVEKLLDTPQHPVRSFGMIEFTRVRRSLRFEQVGYTYPNGTRALTDVAFEIPAGKTVALVGASGSGKTTIASLLLRFRPPTSGRITVDGEDYWAFSSESWHCAVAVVEQEAFLFHDTMAQNIGYGFPEVTSEQIQEAVRMAYLEDMVNALPEGLNTVVGERGTMLSGGQRQRLAIARALVRNPKLLILDEATSALDSISERQVQAALESAMRDRTVLVIAHRLSTIRNAEQIVVLEGGRVVEQGTWEDLVARNGVFARVAVTVDRSKNLPV